MRPKYKIDAKPPSTWTLILLLSFPSVAGVSFTPSLPAIMEFFNLSRAESALSVTLFLFSYALSQLIYGPISNAWGRKRSLYVGLTIAFISSILAGLSSLAGSYLWLLIGRFFQGIGSGVGLNLTFTIINDFYHKEEARKIIPTVSLSYASLPFVGMLVGGFIITYLNWQSYFYAFAVYTAYILWQVHYLPETFPEKDLSAMKPDEIVRRYKTAFMDPRIMLYALLFGCTTSMIYIFSASAPLIVIGNWKYTAAAYGLLSLIPSFGYVTGNLLSKHFSSSKTARELIFAGVFCIFLATVFLQIFSHEQNVFGLYIPIYLVYIGIPLSHTNASLLATTHFPDRSISASVMSFTNIFFTFLMVQTAKLIPDLSIALAFFALLFVMGLIFCVSEKHS